MKSNLRKNQNDVGQSGSAAFVALQFSIFEKHSLALVAAILKRPACCVPIGLVCGLLLVVCGLFCPSLAEAGGTWTALNNAPPAGVNNALLLSDGTVICGDGGQNWYRLTPDIHGSYVNGTWNQIASMNYGRLFYSLDVLTNGNVYVCGGEYGAGDGHAELYDSLANAWTVIPSPAGANYSDACSKILPNGNVLQSDSQSGLYIYNTVSNILAGAGAVGTQDQNEACWVRLPNDNILTIYGYGQGSQHYVPSLNQWYNDGNVPVAVYGYGAELGGAFVLPNGNVFQIGGTTNTAIYTPGNTLTAPGTWVAGPPMVFGTNQLGAVDAPAAMMVNGKILCDIGPVGGFNGPCSFYEYDYVANAFTLVSAPGGGTSYGSVPFANSMLDLPDGTVLFIGGQGSQSLYVYQPDGTPLAAGQPVISSIVENTNGTYHLTGVGFNGITGGAAYGDDWQMDTSYPLVRLTNTVSGNVYYARTYQWSSTTIQNTNPVTTEFLLPINLPAGSYSLVVTANGNASAPVNFNYVPTAAPSGLTGTVGNAQTVLSWNAVAGATAYNVRRLTTTMPPYYAIVATVTGTSCTNIGLVNAMSYFYVVTAVSAGGESTNSSSIIITPAGPPSTPAGVSATPDTAARIDLAWAASYGATSYNINRSTVHNGPYTQVANPVNPFYTDTGLTNGVTYYYVVSATNSSGESANSVEVSATAQAIGNFGFETPSIGAGNYQYVPTNGTFWVFSGTNGNGSGLVANGSGFANPNAPQGVQAAFIQSNGVISQVLSGFTPGATYTVTCAAAQRSGSSQHGGESWNVKIDNTVIQTNSPGSTGYVDYTATFVATAVTHTLSFVGTDLAGGDNTVFLDNVRIGVLLSSTANNSFELPVLGTGNYQYNPSGGSWTFSGASPNGSGIIANGSAFSNPNAPDGVQAAFIQEYGTISQTISGFIPGTTYAINYDAAQRAGYNESWNVKVNGVVIQTNVPGGTSYADYTAYFTATSASQILFFTGTDLAGGDNTVFLDNVSIISTLQPVAPAITLTTPTNSLIVIAPATVSLAATVATNGNQISSVQFYYDATNLIGQDSTPPYNYNWSSLISGKHNVFARVVYNGSNVLDSAAVAVTVINTNIDLGFELPAIGSGNYEYNPSGGSWVFGGSSGSGSGIVANGSGFSNPNAVQGTQAAFIQSYGLVSQTLSGFTPGVTYTITFSAAQRPAANQHGGESWNVLIDGTVITNYNPGGTGYTTYSASFTAWAAIHTLSFAGTDLAGGDNTAFIDNVKIVPPVPQVAPLITLTAPVNNAGYNSLATINLAAAVTTNTNQINAVNFYYNSTNLIGQVTTVPYNYVWNNVGAGSYSVNAQVVYNLSNTVNSTAVNITVTNTLPPPWLTGDVGSVGVMGGAGYAGSVFTLAGSGTDIAGLADAFRYVYQPVNGNCDIRARVTSVSNTSPGAKAGVMIRETLTAGSTSALTDVTPGNGVEFIWRANAGGNSSATNIAGLNTPYWVRLVRNKNTFTAYSGTDGVNWNKTGTSQTIVMATNVYAGLAVCSQNNAVSGTATFDNVTLPTPPSNVYTAPQLSAGLPAGGVFTLQFQGVSDLNYVVQTSTNLTDWTAVFTNALIDANSGTFVFTDTNMLDSARFYRVSQ